MRLVCEVSARIEAPALPDPTVVYGQYRRRETEREKGPERDQCLSVGAVWARNPHGARPAGGGSRLQGALGVAAVGGDPSQQGLSALVTHQHHLFVCFLTPFYKIS